MKNSKKGKTAFIASRELLDKIKELQGELKVESPGEVIAMGLQLIDLSLGREVEFIEGDKTYKTKKFANFNQTVILDDDGGSKK